MQANIRVALTPNCMSFLLICADFFLMCISSITHEIENLHNKDPNIFDVHISQHLRQNCSHLIAPHCTYCAVL